MQAAAGDVRETDAMEPPWRNDGQVIWVQQVLAAFYRETEAPPFEKRDPQTPIAVRGNTPVLILFRVPIPHSFNFGQDLVIEFPAGILAVHQSLQMKVPMSYGVAKRHEGVRRVMSVVIPAHLSLLRHGSVPRSEALVRLQAHFRAGAPEVKAEDHGVAA